VFQKDISPPPPSTSLRALAEGRGQGQALFALGYAAGRGAKSRRGIPGRMVAVIGKGADPSLVFGRRSGSQMAHALQAFWNRGPPVGWPIAGQGLTAVQRKTVTRPLGRWR